MNVVNFNYEGNEIPFRVNENGEVFMNATKMAEPFEGKRVKNFLRGKDLSEYINASHESKLITQIRVIAESPMIQVVRGRGEDSGTWFQEDLALRYS
jgi:plasmid maintenance system killer protein